MAVGEGMGRGRRRRQPDPFEIIGPILGLIFILMFFFPNLFKAIVGLMICGGVAFVLFVIIRKIVRSRGGQSGLVPPRSSSEEPPVIRPRGGTVKPFDYLNPFESIPRSEWGLDKSAGWLAEFAQGQSLEQTEPTRLPSVQERLRAIDWFQFEKLVEILYRRSGYEVERLGGANGRWH